MRIKKKMIKESRHQYFSSLIKNIKNKKILHLESNSRILYSAVVLDKESKSNLIAFVEECVDIPYDWDKLGDHMTIVFKNELPPELKSDLGETVKLYIKKIGISDDAIAVEVEGYPTTKDIPHITVAIPSDGKAVNSNYITDWEEVNDPLILNGKVTEVRY